MAKLSTGDRVESCLGDHRGVVLSADPESVVVRWDDGKVGILVYDRKVAHCAYWLQKLAKVRV